MLAPRTISVYLNNALTPINQVAELDCEATLPEIIREMPDDVNGHFTDLDPDTAHEIEAAFKRVMILNATRVLYTFTYDASTKSFTAHKR
uniref:Uncharacterized protein n=1 Tax=Solibacter usitatus (strain Ellin6076) TaxID=234267 RepID=Q01QI3_SOLUE